MYRTIRTIIIFFTSNFLFSSDTVQIGICAKQTEKMNIFIGLINSDENLKNNALKIKADIEFSGQFIATIDQVKSVTSKNEIRELEKKGFQFIIFLDKCSKDCIEWRLYDAPQLLMISGKKVYQTKDNKSSISHQIADDIITVLTGQESSFASMLVACKQINVKKRRRYYNNIYGFHPVEYFNKLSEPKLIVEEKTICVAPRWNCSKPFLYYSKHSSYNLRLMCIDNVKRKSLVSNFDGLNLTPAFSCDGKIVISLTRNGKGRLCKYEFDENKEVGVFTPITDSKIHAICPSFIDNDNIVFCAIDKLNRARIAKLNLKNNEINFLTNDNEQCVSPCVDSKNKIIAYCKKINGTVQVFSYSMENNDHKQLTFSIGDKDEISCSPCGNFLAYSIDCNGKSRIAIFNILTNEQKLLTPSNENWSYPTWSPVYNTIPFI